MSNHTAWVLIITGRQILVIASGTLFAYWGYRLFRDHGQSPAGDISVSWRTIMLKLQRGAHGTFFALFGAAVVGVTAWHGIMIEEGTERRPSIVGFTANVADELPQDVSHPQQPREESGNRLARADRSKELNEQANVETPFDSIVLPLNPMPRTRMGDKEGGRGDAMSGMTKKKERIPKGAAPKGAAHKVEGIASPLKDYIYIQGHNQHGQKELDQLPPG
jgi:hypothetical protein